MTNDEFVTALKSIYEKRAEIVALQKERQVAEIALNVEYKVDECNTKKNALNFQYNVQIQALSKEIYALEAEIGVKV